MEWELDRCIYRAVSVEGKKILRFEGRTNRQTDRQTDRQTKTPRQETIWVLIMHLPNTQVFSIHAWSHCSLRSLSEKGPSRTNPIESTASARGSQSASTNHHCSADQYSGSASCNVNVLLDEATIKRGSWLGDCLALERMPRIVWHWRCSERLRNEQCDHAWMEISLECSEDAWNMH